MVIDYLTETTTPLNCDFENFDRLVERLCEKMGVKNIFDQLAE